MLSFSTENVQCVANNFLERTGETRRNGLSHVQKSISQ